MKNRKMLKILLVLLAVVIMGVTFSCQSNPDPNAAQQTQEVLYEEPDEEPEEDTQTQEETQETSSAQAGVCVHVCGCVNNPGVYYLKTGARVHEAVEAAGGLTRMAADDHVNLAGVVSDGEKIYIPSMEETKDLPADQDNETKEAAEKDSRVNINTATEEQLMQLPGIGESKAKAIIAYREEKGAFAEIGEIQKVSGIGEGVYEQIKKLIKV